MLYNCKWDNYPPHKKKRECKHRTPFTFNKNALHACHCDKNGAHDDKYMLAI